MDMHWRNWLRLGLLLIPSSVFAQQACVQVDGTVTDPTGAVIPGARVQTAEGVSTTSDAAGHFQLPCVRPGMITARAEGFTSGSASVREHLMFRLEIANVETVVNVDAGVVDADRAAGTTTLNATDVQRLADDPDDFVRQLQALSASGGGSAASTLFMVDGFKNGSSLPPKSSIASVRVNPDLFSSEYQTPPWDAEVIEVTTKPGGDALHGALFYSDSDSIFNATDPFSASSTPADKRRYGVELSVPIERQKSGFALALEKRDIDEFNIVNAVTLNADGVPASLQQTISAPQRLWIGSARADWQVRANDVAILSFSSNSNRLQNEGVGGLTLAEAGFAGLVRENDLRFINSLILSPNLLHETRVGFSWKRSQQSPLSAAPQLVVSGYFTGGGSSALNAQERDLEIDDDLLLTRGKHQWKFGVQSLGIFEHDYDPNNFNGTYVFGGGSAPVLDAGNDPTGQTTTISAIEQYRRAQNNLPGGTPTTYQLTSGTPLVSLTQWQLGLYVQDTFKLTPRLTASAGIRYALQTSPDSLANLGPRLSLSWSPDRKQTWVFRARTGLFSELVTPDHALEVARLNQVRQQKATVYSPDYANPMVPVAGSIAVGTVQQFPRSLVQPLSWGGYFNVEHELPHHWTVKLNFWAGANWNVLRTRNINAPMVESSVAPPDPTAALLAPRPFAANRNILEYQHSGHFTGNVLSFGVSQHDFKHFGLFSYYAYRNSKTDGGHENTIPQSSYTDAGESARADWASHHLFFLAGNLDLPFGLQLTSQFQAQQGTPYNITTGTDNNGDGVFNDRPSYTSASGAGVYSTRFGLLTANTVNGDVPRNLGTMPTTIHLDANLSRSFSLKSSDKGSPRTFTLNVRSANLFNHTNVTALQTVLAPDLGEPLSGESGRRLELGARFSF
jgi:Carboxypeptidase regulatory-like domain/TonB dependent receptor